MCRDISGTAGLPWRRLCVCRPRSKISAQALPRQRCAVAVVPALSFVSCACVSANCASLTTVCRPHYAIQRYVRDPTILRCYISSRRANAARWRRHDNGRSSQHPARPSVHCSTAATAAVVFACHGAMGVVQSPVFFCRTDVDTMCFPVHCSNPPLAQIIHEIGRLGHGAYGRVVTGCLRNARAAHSDAGSNDAVLAIKMLHVSAGKGVSLLTDDASLAVVVCARVAIRSGVH